MIKSEVGDVYNRNHMTKLQIVMIIIVLFIKLIHSKKTFFNTTFISGDLNFDISVMKIEFLFLKHRLEKKYPIIKATIILNKDIPNVANQLNSLPTTASKINP